MPNLLTALPAGVRASIYCLFWLAGLAFTAWEGAHGDWHLAIPAFIAAVVGALAHSNVSGSANAGLD